MSATLDWNREIHELLDEDATAQRQLDEHAQLLPIATGGEAIRFIATRLREHWLATVGTLLVIIGGSIAGAILPRLIGSAVDLVDQGASRSAIWGLGGQILALGIAQAVLAALGWWMVSALGQKILATMREQVIDRALDLPAQRMEQTGIGDALSRVADDVDVAARAVNNLVPNLIQLAFYVIVTMIGMATLSPWLLLLVVTVVPMYVLAGRWFLSRTAPLYRRDRIAKGARAQGLLSAIHGIPTVHAYGIEKRETRHVAVLSETASLLMWKVMRLVGRLVVYINVPENIALVMVVVLGFVMVQGGAPIGVVTAACIYLVSLFWPMLAFIFNLDDVQSAGASLARMVGVIESIDPAASPGSEKPQDASIRLEDVSHAYTVAEDGSERVVLHPIDLEIAPGQAVALVGASGAGKSTLAAIIAGTLQPRHGRVLHGGADLAHADLESIRQHASIVSQDVHVFRGPLRDDLRLASPEATDEQLWDALRAVEADAWVERLPKGLDTEVGEKGERLTAEQSQQLALARVVLQDPAVLVMDEATADEGSSGARVLERAALTVARGRTTIIVAHRLSQAMEADRIMVMADGAVVEEGSHNELVARGGAYARLWEAWTR